MTEGRFVVAVKESARVNAQVDALAERAGERLEFRTRQRAEQLAEHLSESQERVRIQKAAPQDPANVDGYLLRFPRRSKREPKRSTKRGLSFDVSANQYGELGRALVFGSYGLSGAMRYALRAVYPDLGDGTHRFRAIGEPALPPGVAREVSWHPDCLVELISRASGQRTHRAFCEIKTGAASYQRGQLEDMKRVARRHDVLKVRVDIRAVPAEYRLKVERVAGGTPGDAAAAQAD